jgi:hypothetical protein
VGERQSCGGRFSAWACSSARLPSSVGRCCGLNTCGGFTRVRRCRCPTPNRTHSDHSDLIFRCLLHHQHFRPGFLPYWNQAPSVMLIAGDEAASHRWIGSLTRRTWLMALFVLLLFAPNRSSVDFTGSVTNGDILELSCGASPPRLSTQFGRQYSIWPLSAQNVYPGQGTFWNASSISCSPDWVNQAVPRHLLHQLLVQI